MEGVSVPEFKCRIIIEYKMWISKNSPVRLGFGAFLLWGVLWSVCAVSPRNTSNNISVEITDTQTSPVFLSNSRLRVDGNYGTVDRLPIVVASSSSNQTEAHPVVVEKGDDEEVYAEEEVYGEEEGVSVVSERRPEQVEMKIRRNRNKWDSRRKRRSSNYDYSSNRGGQTPEGEGARIRRPELNKRGT